MKCPREYGGTNNRKQMKKSIFNYIFFILGVVILFQGCVKESFEGDDLGDSGTTFLKTPDGDVVVHWLTPFSDHKTVNLFNLFKDAHNKAELNSKNTVKLVFNPAIIDEYNEENETEFAVLPSSYFKWASTEGVSYSGNDITINFGDGLLYGNIAIDLDGSKWTDLAQKYALAFVVTDNGGISPSSTMSDTVVVELGLKNAWDGVFKWTGTLVDAVSGDITHISGPYAEQGYGDYEIQLQTIGETKVAMFDDILWGDFMYPMYSGGWSGYGSFAPVFEFNKETNEIISVTNYYGQPAANTRSAQLDPSGENIYDPSTGTIKVKYFMLQPSTVPAAPYIRAQIDEEFVFVRSR